jgi:hypothetical protein
MISADIDSGTVHNRESSLHFLTTANMVIL